MNIKLEVWPSKVLGTVAKRVTSVSQAKQLKKQLEYASSNLCWHAPLGLAAPQIGKAYRACFVQDIYMVNPIIKYRSPAKHISGEGCFSSRGFGINVKRSDNVVVEWQDEDLKPQYGTFFDREADIVQHELDHLDGITIMDKGEI